MRNIIIISAILIAFVLTASCVTAQKSQQVEDAIKVEAKVWSKDKQKKVQYSDWQSFNSITINQLKGLKEKTEKLDKYGGFGDAQKSNGYFQTKQLDGRWWVIDPEGKRITITAVNSIRTGKKSEVPMQFKSLEDWMNNTIPVLQDAGFNTAGSWSDVDAIIAYNKTAEKPFIYTIQLSLLSNYVQQVKKKDPSRKGTSQFSFMFDDDFPAFCERKFEKNKEWINDSNLLGYFSDNELDFTTGEFKDIIESKNESDKSYLALVDWLKSKNVLPSSDISNELKQEFMGLLADKYYSIVSRVIKKNDPNHLYIGSRLHSNAIKNPVVVKAAGKYCDILSFNYYGEWEPKEEHLNNWVEWTGKPFFITEFYTKAEETGMTNKSGAGWIVRTQKDRGIHYQNFCLKLLANKYNVGWHWFRYQDNDPTDANADESNKDSNKGIVNLNFEYYKPLIDMMKELNIKKYSLIRYYDKK